MAVQDLAMTDFGLFREDFGNASIGTNLTATTQTVTHANVQPTTNAYTATEYPLVGDGFLESTFTITPSNTNHGILIYRIDMVNDSFDLLDKSLGFRLTNATVDLIGWASDDTDSQGVIVGLDTDIPFTVTLSGRVQLPLSGINIDIAQGQNTFNLTANCLGSSDALVEPFGYKLGCFIESAGEGFDITAFSFADGQVLPLSATFTPNPIVVADDTVSVVLEAFPSDGIAPYSVEWLYDGVTLLSTDNPYTFPTDVSKRGHYVLGRVTDDDSDVVDLHMNIVGDSTYWLTEPLDYTGAEGSTMPVDGSVNVTANATEYGAGGLPFNNGDWTVIAEPVTITADLISCESNVLGTAFAVNDAISLTENHVVQHTTQWISGVYWNHRMLSTASENVQVLIFGESSGHTVQVYQDGLTFSQFVNFICVISDEMKTELSFTETTITISYAVYRSGVLVYSNSFTAGFASLAVSKVSCASFISVNNYTSIKIFISTTFTHKDNLGNTIGTAVVSKDGTYSVPMLNMQPSNSGTHNLEAIQGSSTIYSPFEVLITAIQWDQEPSDVSIDEGSSINVSASVTGYSGDVTFELISWYGATVDTQVVQDGSYSFSIPNAQEYETGQWLLKATDSSGTIESYFNVVVSAVPVVIKEYGEYIYLLEISGKIDYEPSLAISANLIENVNNSIISKIATGEPEGENYWTDWGGTYDNPKSTDIELFYGQFLIKVDSIEALVLTEMSFAVLGNSVYSNTQLYPWQYFRALSSTRSAIGFSTTVRDPISPSDDEYGGRRYPVKLSVPKVANVGMPDPINGIILSGMFKATLENGDGYFDGLDNLSLFNSPARLLKTAVLKPQLEDFDVIRYGLVETQKVNFKTFTIGVAEVFRTLSAPVCRTITLSEYPDAVEKVGSIIPVAWGSIVGAPLIDVSDGSNQYICCDVDYIKDVSEVYDRDGKSITFLFIPETGVISTSESASTCDFVGKETNKIGEIIVSEVSTKANIAYVAGVWDIEETDRYTLTSSSINLLFSGADVKKLVEECVKSDSAFFMTKNNGLVTIRRFGDEYETHTIEEWRTTIDPDKDYSDQKYFASSIAIGYNHDYDSKSSKQYYINYDQESNIVDIYNKTQRLTYETKIASKIEAGSLSQRLFKRLSRRSEIVQFRTSANTALINIGDTVIASVDVNGRKISQFTNWFVVGVNPAQDTLELEQKFAEISSISGILSHPSSALGSGILSQPTNENGSGKLSQPLKVTEV